MKTLLEGFTAAVEAVRVTNEDFSFGKPDQSDFVRVVLEVYGFPLDGEFIEKTATMLFEDAGTYIVSGEALVVFVYDRASWILAPTPAAA